MSQPNTSEPKRTGGGVATTAGIDFQNRVAAWLAVRVLAETVAQPLWGWPANSSLRFIRCETEQPVDDILVGSSNDDLAFIQVKRTISASSGSDSALASVFDQFARQVLRPALTTTPPRVWDRRFNAVRDRLVLAIGRDSSGTIATDCRDALAKLRLLPSGSLADPAFNAAEKTVLETIRGHAATAWCSHDGRMPDEANLLALLKATYVEVIDVEAGGSGEREAKELVRRSVVGDPAQADLAWARMLEICTGYSRNRGGGGQGELRQALSAAGIALNALPSYQADIEKLRKYSQQTIRLLARFSEIKVGRSEKVKIQRVSTTALARAVIESSMLVIGEPGAGKSGALHDLAGELMARGLPVLCLATDEIESSSVEKLRGELGLEHPLNDVLANWGTATQPVVFITDALDAARTDYAGDMFRNVIEAALEPGSNCRVVASIRMFDLRHDHRLHTLFAGKPHKEFRADEFGKVSHFQVPLLDPGELKQLAAQSKGLDQLVQAVVAGDNADMKKLIAVPFNLRLLGELVGEGVAIEALTPIRTQIELLDRYWAARVIRHDGLGDARETVLRKVAQSMFGSRLLHASRAALGATTSESKILQDLLSESILQEYRPGSSGGLDRQNLKFPHHLLFDYAVARLLFRIEHAGVAELIAADPDCVVAFRPSLVLHFRHLWATGPAGHGSFWQLLDVLEQDPAIPLVGKIIGPAVAVESFEVIGDFQPFVAAIDAAIATEEGRRTVTSTVSHLIGAQAAKGGIKRKDDAEAVRWAAFAVELARNVGVFAYALRHLLHLLCNPAEGIPAAAQPAIGEAGRKLLGHALEPGRPADGSLVRVGLESVARSFASDPGASGAVLRRMLESGRVARYGHSELFFLAQEVPRLAGLDAALVAEIYRISFTEASDSEEQTYMGGGSRIMPLLSNVRQDWGSVHYSLAEAFPGVIRKLPREAVVAAMAAVASYVESEHPRKDPIEPAKLRLLGRDVVIQTDYSSIWDSKSSFRNREGSALSLLDEVQKYLGEIAGDPAKGAEVDQLLASIVENSRHAVVWRRLLKVGADHPEAIGRKLSPLAIEDAALTSIDLTEEIGGLLEAVFPILSEGERTVIEAALLALAEQENGNDYGEKLRDRFIGCLPRSAVVSDAVRQRLAELDKDGGPPPNTPHFSMGSFEHSNVSDEEFLRHRGIPVDEPANKALLDLVRPLKVRVENSVPKDPPAEEPGARLNRLQQIKAALGNAAISPELLEQAHAYLAEDCARVLRSTEGGLEALKEFGRQVLLEVAEQSPVGPLETNEQFDRMPGWGSPNARIAAVEGLLLSKDKLTPATQEAVEQAIDLLAKCPEPEIRFTIARYAGAYHRSNEARMWRLLRQFAEADPSLSVLASVVSTVSRTTSAKGIELAEIIFQRVGTKDGRDGPREICLSYFLSLHIEGISGEVGKHLETVATTPWVNREDTGHILAGLRGYLAYGEVEPASAMETATRQRAQKLLRRILVSASEELAHLAAKYEKLPLEEVPEKVRKKVEAIHRCIHSVCDTVYFASGAFEQRERGGGRKEKLSPAARRRFWAEMKDILALLGTSKVPSVSYHLVETLESLVEFDPKAVFLEISRAVQSGKAGGFQFESLVADMAVRLVKEFIATHRGLLKDDKQCRRALVEILDTFVEAGWPAAQQLTFGLEDIFR